MTYYKNDGSEHGNDRFSFKDTDNTVEYLVNVTVNLINDPPSFAKADKVRDPLMVPLGRPILEVQVLNYRKVYRVRWTAF